MTQMEIEWLEPGDPGYKNLSDDLECNVMINPLARPLFGSLNVQLESLQNASDKSLQNASDMEQKSNI